MRSIRKNLTLIGLFILLGSLALPACSSKGKDDAKKTIKVAVVLPTGIDVGKEMLNAAQMALDEAGGKAGSVEVQLVSYSSSEESNPVSKDMERNAANQAVKDGEIVAYLGAVTSDQAREVIPVLNQAGMPIVSPSATWPGLTKPGFGAGEPGIYYPTGRRNFFRVLPADDSQGTSGAHWASALGAKKVYILDDGSAYGKGIAGIFEAAAPDVNLEIMAHDSLPTSATPEEITAAAKKAADAQPDLLYFGGAMQPFGIQTMRELRTASPTLRILAPEGMYQDQVIRDVGAGLVEGIYVTTLTTPVDQLASASTFAQAYQAKYSTQPVSYVVSSYEAMKVLLYAIGKADKPTRQGIIDSLTNLGQYSGVLGTWTFDSNGDTTLKTVSGWQIKNGQWSFVQVIK